MGSLKLNAVPLLLILGCGGDAQGVHALPGTPARDHVASADPSLANDPERGDLLLTWVGDEGSGWRLYFSRSRDGGDAWSRPVRVTSDTGEVKPHGEASPRLVAGPGGRLAVVWPRDVPVAGRRWPASTIRVARSLDGGRTWLAPVTINDDTTAAPVGHNFQGAAWAGDSGLVAAWLDERAGTPMAHHHDRAATAKDSTSEADATDCDTGALARLRSHLAAESGRMGRRVPVLPYHAGPRGRRRRRGGMAAPLSRQRARRGHRDRRARAGRAIAGAQGWLGVRRCRTTARA